MFTTLPVLIAKSNLTLKVAFVREREKELIEVPAIVSSTNCLHHVSFTLMHTERSGFEHSLPVIFQNSHYSKAKVIKACLVYFLSLLA